MNKSKYIINQNLIEVMFNKVTKDEGEYGKSLVSLTNEELEKKIKEFQNQGFIVNTYHQEEFDDGWRFIKDGEGLDDVTEEMTYSELKKLLNQCQREVQDICKREILNGNIEQIRQGDYPFGMGKRVYNILLKYARKYGKCIRTIIPLESLLYIVSCIGNVYQLIDIIDELRFENIYLYFLNSGCMTDDPEDICSDLHYSGILLNEWYLEDLLTIMHRNSKLSDEQYKKYAWFPYEFDTDISIMDTKEFDKCMEIWEL